MIAAILLVISIVALLQFGVYYWRALVASVASQPLSDTVRAAAGLSEAAVSAKDFDAVVSLHEMTPGLGGESTGLRAVRAYCGLIQWVGRLALLRLPRIAVWSEREMAICSRYVAVVVDQRMQRNLACASEIRSC